MNRRFLVSSAPGLQALLAEELRELGLEPTVEASGSVTLEGDWAAAARVLVHSRIASRIHVSLRRFASRSQAMLYDQVRRIDWASVFSAQLSMVVEAHGSTQGTDFTLAFAPLKVKDAICDEFRKHGGPRPDVDRGNPDVRVTAFFFEGRCELSLDLAGEPLHRRGYRKEGAEAPLRENRAAALLRFAEYDGSRPLVDPFCGSGTIVIEAALIATRTAPGLLRPVDRFAMTRLVPDSRALLEAQLRAARADILDRPPHPIRGTDTSEAVLRIARSNAEKAKVAAKVEFHRADAREIAAPESWIVSNPPYGERLEDPEVAKALLREFVHGVKHRCVGSRLALVLPRGDLEKAVGLRPLARVAVESGSLGLRFLSYGIRAGKFQGR